MESRGGGKGERGGGDKGERRRNKGKRKKYKERREIGICGREKMRCREKKREEA